MPLDAAAPGALPRAALVPRPRLVGRVQRRFEVRLTTIVGGGGSGKTTLLADAMRTETEHVDVWYPCSAADRSGDRLLAGLVRACATRVGRVAGPDDDDPLARLSELVLGATPRRVCLVIDDAHVLGRSSLIDELISTLPVNGHVLVSGRSLPPINSARLDAAGQLEEIVQDDLLLDDAEVVTFANLRGVDVDLLRPAGGWPAFVELASTGTEARSRRYLDEEALAGLSADRRRRLAAFAFVGGGDGAVSTAVTGWSLDLLLADLPLVRWAGEHAQLHDLWTDLLVHELTEDDRRQAAVAAAAVARDRRDIDRAVDLAASVEAWDDVLDSLSAAVCDGVDGGLGAQQLRRWRAVLPNDAVETPMHLLVEGLLARELDQTSTEAMELFDRAAARFADGDEHELELVALTQLGYLTRVGGDPRAAEGFNDRIRRLADVYPPAEPFLAIGEAWTALTEGRPDRQLAALEAIDARTLPSTWQITRRHLIAHALFNLGRANEALTVVPRDIDTLPVPIPGALVTESQCVWHSGHPNLAIAEPPSGTSARHGARDRFVVNSWLGFMAVFAGDVDGARRAKAEATRHVGDRPGQLIRAQLAGLGNLIDLAAGDEESAAAALGQIITEIPLGDGIGEQLFRNILAVPYVLVPESREYWDTATLSPFHTEIRNVAAAFCRARETSDLSALTTLTWPEPGVIAAHVPVRWGVELALHGVRANRHEARQLAAWLAEHWHRPTRDLLAGFIDHDLLGDAARDVLVHTPTPPINAPTLQLLGHTEVSFRGQPTGDPNWRRERVRALLTWLALNPSTTRDRASTAVWPTLDPDRAAKNLRTTLNYLHTVLEPNRPSGDAPWFIRSDGQRLTLHGSLDTDLWQMNQLLDEAAVDERAGHPHEALPRLLAAGALWRGDLAADLDHEWLELERIHVRSRFVRASCRAAELLVATDRPIEAIPVARRALDADPYHEPSYRAMAAAYRAVDDEGAARATEAYAAAQLGPDG
jgi:DNA-binding SARP family transcriptional activator